MSTPRGIWVGHAFRNVYPQFWLLPLEAVDKHKASAKWRFLLGAEAWAEAKAKAKQQARSAEVLALVGGSDSVVCERDHILDAPAFLKFSTRSDGMGSLGLAGT